MGRPALQCKASSPVKPTWASILAVKRNYSKHVCLFGSPHSIYLVPPSLLRGGAGSIADTAGRRDGGHFRHDGGRFRHDGAASAETCAQVCAGM